ncbi:MAG TPA: ferrous iron transport protein A, partial [Firmicutes bacterium]|nr:ferrous iron transport protein A [Bacillota bacterium]
MRSESSETRHKLLPLSDLPIGLRGEVISVGVTGAVRRRLLDLGLVPGTKIEAVRKSPVNDP